MSSRDQTRAETACPTYPSVSHRSPSCGRRCLPYRQLLPRSFCPRLSLVALAGYRNRKRNYRTRNLREVVIDRVLHGHAQHDRDRVREGVEAHLSQLGYRFLRSWRSSRSDGMLRHDEIARRGPLSPLRRGFTVRVRELVFVNRFEGPNVAGFSSSDRRGQPRS